MTALVLLIGLPILEIVVAVWVASWAGFWPMVLALIGLSVLGFLLLPRIGWTSYAKVRSSIERGEDPSTEIVSRMLLLLAAVLLILPGFVTGVIGLVLLLPFVRRAMAGYATRRMKSRVRVVRATYGGQVIDTQASDGSTPTTGEPSPSPQRELDQP